MNLPDPVKERIESLTLRVEQMEKCLQRRIPQECEDCQQECCDDCLKNRKEEQKDEDL